MPGIAVAGCLEKVTADITRDEEVNRVDGNLVNGLIEIRI